jgi:fimbrial chaperone protein
MFVLLQFFLLFFLFNDLYALNVSPTRVNLTAKEPISTLTLSNETAEPIVLQLHIVKWTQADYREILTPSDDILVTPQIFTLNPFSSQLIRLGIEAPVITAFEEPYRLIIQEVQSPFKIKKQGINFLLNLSIPVIVGTNAPIKERIQWNINKVNGHTQLQAINRGNNVVFINLIGALSKNNQDVVQPFSTFSYLLPGSKQRWRVQLLNKLPLRYIKANINNRVVINDVF